MTETKHTPGPWRAEVWEECEEWPYVQRGSEGGTVIIGLSGEQANADAHLIAAAPELLEALEICVNFGHAIAEVMDDKFLKEAILNDVHKAFAAIAKAKGGA